MNLQTIAEHTVLIDILPKLGADILDAGCRDYVFSNYFILKNHRVFTMDPDESVRCVNDDHFVLALSDHCGQTYLYGNHDPQATTIKHNSSMQKTIGLVECITLDSFCESIKTPFFDLIKLDIEGSEYEVIMSMDKPYTMQLSVEFHMHCGQTEKQVQECVDKLHSLGYKTIQHEKTARHGLQPNYWDSLFIL